MPDVAGHVVEAEAVGGEFADGGSAEVAVFGGVVGGEFSLPPVGDGFSAGPENIAPGIFLADQSAVRGVFEFRFGREAFACPVGVGGGVVPGNLHDRLARIGGDAGLLWIFPSDAVGFFPLGVSEAEDRAEAESFVVGFVAGGFDELLELLNGDVVTIDVKWMQIYAVRGSFGGHSVIRAHAKIAAGEENHSIGNSG